MRQLTRPVDAHIERLLTGVVAIATMGFQEVMTALCERHGTLAAVECHESRQALVPEMAEIAVTRCRRFVARVAEIALSDHPKRPDGCKRPAVVAVEFVPMITVDDDLALWSVRQFEIMEEDIARVVIPLADIAISVANVVSAIARVILFSVRARAAAQLDPGHLDVSDFVVAITRIEIIEHRLTSWTLLRDAPSATDEAIIESRGSRSNFRSEDVRSFWGE